MQWWSVNVPFILPADVLHRCHLGYDYMLLLNRLDESRWCACVQGAFAVETRSMSQSDRGSRLEVWRFRPQVDAWPPISWRMLWCRGVWLGRRPNPIGWSRLRLEALVLGWKLGHRFSWRMLRRHGVCLGPVDIPIWPGEVVDVVLLNLQGLAHLVILVCYLSFLVLCPFLLVLLLFLFGQSFISKLLLFLKKNVL
jgi:hypothetical protein